MANGFFPDKVIVLVVEDEPVVRMVAVAIVEDGGFAVLEAGNADEAVILLESRADIRIVFTDIDMPGSMDGVALAVAVRGRWPPIEIIITSGFRYMGADELPARSVFIAKPYEANHLVEMLINLAA